MHRRGVEGHETERQYSARGQDHRCSGGHPVACADDKQDTVPADARTMTAGTAAGQIAGGVVVSSMTEIMPAVRHGDRRKQAGNCAGLYFGTLTFVSEIIQIFGRSSTGESRPAAEILTVGGMSARHVHEEKRETDDYGQATEQREQG